MRTVSTLCASGAGIGIASLGLAVVREETPSYHPNSKNPSPSQPDMTAVAGYAEPNLSSPFAFSSIPRSARAVSEGPNGKALSGNARVGQKRVLTPRTSFSLGMERPPGAPPKSDEVSGSQAGSQPGTPNALSQPHSWLRRLSSNLSTSRDSSQTAVSRPGSSAVSQSNGSVAFSHTGSTTPMFPDNTPPALPPNKLVKRTSSLRSSNGSPFQPSGSRLPLPVFRRPATSHQRSATLQERYSGTDQSDHMSLDEPPLTARDPQLKQYFVPKIASDGLASMRRRSSTGIPNPIKRLYPDRKYKPVLVSASDAVKAAQVEVDDEPSDDEQSIGITKLAMAPSVASSPLPMQTVQFDESTTPRRSFSIGDLLSTGPQPLWRRSSQSRGKTSGSKLVRKGRPRVVSAPQDAMGSTFSRGTGTDSERPAKRRDLTDPQLAQRSIYSSSSSNQHIDPNGNLEVQLNLALEKRQASSGVTNVPFFTEAPPEFPATLPFEQRRLPSANHSSATARPVRVSAAQSEITSTIDSDSEYRSIGDASTDYQSDTVYDSYPTRTTRSSSGKRGPHIETIFDDSPPNFSSGRSTKLKDLLNDGAFITGEHASRYRHSTIEEEESMASTPVRSLQDKSVTSTPSARPGTQQLFMSSPPAMPMMPDPEDIDWDAPDDQPTQNGLGIGQTFPDVDNHQPHRSLPFRFAPSLRHPYPASEGTPQRYNGSTNDRANPFDWSEAQPSPSQNHSPQRPRTVHGKKDPESRGSRPAGRRVPSSMHARSHSVPVVPDVDGKRTNVVANKFGTWGVGSKAVTEDWNEDFDFDELPAPIPESLKYDQKRIDSGHDMFVPKSIREQQENVVANIGLLREWGLLIEELKELRIRAVALDMMNGPYAQAFQEVDAMIELADQESEEQTLEPRRSPPSSPGFDSSAFEEPRSREQSLELPDPIFQEHETPIAFASPGAGPSAAQYSHAGRPRKDSEAVARSVIQALQSKRNISEPTGMRSEPQAKKVPFDTATLRHIVPYVKDLKRKVKDALRETEGLYSSPRRRTSPALRADNEDEPAFRSIFNEPHDESQLARQRSRREQAATDHDGTDDPTADRRSDLADRMQDLNLPH